MRNAAKRTRENRTITVDFRDEATYFRLMKAARRFFECVIAFLLALGFQLKHQATVAGEGPLTRHSALYPSGSMGSPSGVSVHQVSSRVDGFSPFRLVLELEAKRQQEGDHTFEKRLAAFNQAKVGRFVSKIHGDGTVSRVRLAAFLMCHPHVRRSWHLMIYEGGISMNFQENREGLRALPLSLGNLIISFRAVPIPG